jgi:hypothetical protein
VIEARRFGDLFVIGICFSGPKNRSISVQALVDSGSTDCVCTYRVPTGLWTRPIDFQKTVVVDRAAKRRPIYVFHLGFDNHQVCVPVVRVEQMPAGIDFIVGMSFLRHCKTTIDRDQMYIEWVSTENEDCKKT